MFEMRMPDFYQWIQRHRTKRAIRKLDAHLRADIGYPLDEDNSTGVYDGMTWLNKERKR